jgi:tetratricopeptide (TPR) repeat protein
MRFLLVALISCIPAILSAQKSVDVDNIYALIDKEQYPQALKEINVLIDKDSTVGEYYILRGKVYERQKKYQNAFTAFDQAVAKEPGNYEMYRHRGSFYYFTQNPDLAISDYNMALKYHAKEDSIKYHLINDRGSASMMKRDFQSALQDFITVLNFDSTDLAALSNAGTVLGQMNRPNEAKPFLEKLIKIYPDKIHGYINLGFVNEQTGEYTKAIALYNKVIELDPTDALSFNNRGFCKFKLNDVAGAMKDINHSIELYPENSYAYKNRAVINLSRNETKKACADLNKAIDLGFSEMYGTEVYLLIQKHCK